jgi:hypothetical protein
MQEYIALATVITSGGAVTSVSDGRIQSNDDRQQTVVKYFEPDYDGVAYAADGTNNVGQLVLLSSGANLSNYYKWTSTNSSLQDYDILLRVRLPSDFVRWSPEPFVVTYKSDSANQADNKLDISMFDTNGNPVTLIGNTTGLASTSWASTNLAYADSPQWTNGSGALIRMHLSAKNTGGMCVGTISAKYIRITGQE